MLPIQSGIAFGNCFDHLIATPPLDVPPGEGSNHKGILKMRYFLTIAALLFSVSFAHAQGTTQLCFNTNGSNCRVGAAAQAKVLSTASTNSNSIATGGRTLFDIVAVNTNAATAYLKLYDKASGPTCNTDTVLQTFPLVQNIPVVVPSIVGREFTLGIGICITGAMADNDNTNATTGIAVNLTYK
jgi:hypothetical protein